MITALIVTSCSKVSVSVSLPIYSLSSESHHYLPVLMKKPGALRNGAPFKDWALPPALTQVRAKLKQHVDGDRQFVKVLGALLDHDLAAVEAACAEALEAGIASGDVILTVLARRRQPRPAARHWQGFLRPTRRAEACRWPFWRRRRYDRTRVQSHPPGAVRRRTAARVAYR
jgi:hypothetical protein